MATLQFIQLLEDRKLAPPGVIAALRKQVGAASKPVSPNAVAKALIDKQILTPFLAQQLIDEAQATGTKAPIAKPTPVPLPDLSDDLGLTELPGAAPAKPVEKPAPKAAPPAKPTAQPTATKPAQKPAEKKPVVLSNDLANELGLGSSPADDLFSNSGPASDLADLTSADALGGLSDFADPLAATTATTAATLATAAPTITASAKRPINWLQWSSIGTAVFLLLVCTLYYFLRDNGDQAWATAKQTWEENPTSANTLLTNFIEQYPQHANCSDAAVCLNLNKLKELEQADSDPKAQLAKTIQILKELASEPAVAQAQPKLEKQLNERLAQLLEQARKIDPQNKALRQEYSQLVSSYFEVASDPRLLPYEKRSQRRFDDYAEDIAQLNREQARTAAWEAALPELKGANAKSKLQSLARDYPELVSTPAWQTAAQAAGLIAGGAK
jgi:hypothetical protein